MRYIAFLLMLCFMPVAHSEEQAPNTLLRATLNNAPAMKSCEWSENGVIFSRSHSLSHYFDPGANHTVSVTCGDSVARSRTFSPGTADAKTTVIIAVD